MSTDTHDSTTEASRLRLDDRIASLERIAVVLPVVAAGALLILSLFLPFVTVTSSQRDDELVSLSQLGLLFFGAGPSTSSGDSGDIDAAGVLFGVAFLGLFLVMLGTLVGMLIVARGRVSVGAARVITTFGVLLVIGTAGAWLVIALGAASESPWLPEAGSLTLVASALLVGTVTFLPAFRGIWMRR